MKLLQKLAAAVAIAAAVGIPAQAYDNEDLNGKLQGLSVSSPAVPVAAVAAEQEGLRKAWVDSLLEYHRVNGNDDASGLTGIQYPPVPGVKDGDAAGLSVYIDCLALFLSGQPGMGYNPAPTDPAAQDSFRAQVAQAAAQDIRASAEAEFRSVAAGLKDPALKLFVQRALEKAQPDFWRAPSSSTGKHHPADEVNYAGLLVHSIRNAVVGRMLARYFQLPDGRYDVITAALLLHDMQKGGIPWKHDLHPEGAPDSGYVADHGPVAAEWLKQFEGDCGSECDAVIGAVRNHMAQWNKPVPTPPKVLEDQIVSYADYLASRDYAYVSWKNAAARLAR